MIVGKIIGVIDIGTSIGQFGQVSIVAPV